MARRTKATGEDKAIEYVAHRKDKRVNIPTAELADFAVKEERAPYILRYPRKPELDPQLVWRGKDEQDGQDLEVPAVPVYIQEHIHPSAIIKDLRREQAEGKPRQATLFDDFNGMPLEQRVDFYHHAQGWSNRMILGDSLLVMVSLAEKEGLKGQVQMVYLDPPYGIKFGSNWQVSTRKRDVRDGRVEDATREPEQIRAFRDTWKLGIHSYLAYWRDRLVVAQELLTETGSIFVQIGDENVHLVRSVLDEVFGSENFVAQIAFQTATSQNAERIQRLYDFLLWYGKTSNIKFRRLYRKRTSAELEGTFTNFDAELSKRFKSAQLSESLTDLEMSRIRTACRLTSDANYFKRFEDDFSVTEHDNVWYGTVISTFSKEKVYAVQTSTIPIQRCLLMTTDPGDLVLDPTCGSGTTAYVAEQWGRRWITIDTSRVAIALARTRLMSARFPYYILADTSEGIKKQSELAGQPPPSPLPPTEGDIKKGFVYRRVPHVTLKSIANNPDIKEGMTRAEIDAAIARHAESETIYDQPYEDNKVVRVTGPFTVESLSPHRVLSAEQPLPKTQEAAARSAGPGQFETMVLENLKKAGVQQYEKQERIKFDRLEPFAGLYIQGEGEYEENGQAKRVAVCIGPEHGTVGVELVKEAAKEAVRGIGFDLLIVCGFAFDPHVNEEAKRYGKLKVLTAKINPDLQMGDEFLKKTGAGNLFMVFGEPDIEVKKQKDGKLVVEIKGLDVYDPTTGQVRSHSTDDIACWFIDTDYNNEAFFVRHAYFCGDDECCQSAKWDTF